MDDKTSQEPVKDQSQKITIEVVNKTGEAQEKTSPGFERKDTGMEYKYNPEYHRFCDDLGIDKYRRDDSRIADKVALLYDWAKEQVGTEDGATISKAIADLTTKLGVQARGELLTDYLFRWVRMDMASEKIRTREKEKEMVEKEMSMKQEIKKIEPRISDEDLENRVKEGMKDVQKKIKARVKSQITKSINLGIQQALKQAYK